jgi:hypothetical protein
MRHLNLLLALGLLLPTVPSLASDDHIALVRNASGPISVHRDSGALDVVSGMTLYKSDRLVSGPGASAGVAFKDGTQITLGPSTELQLRDFAFEPMEAKYAFSVYLAKGSAVYASGTIGKLAPQAVNVETPTATVGVRGTRFIITADSPQP